jgi:hypothetical protein
VPKAVRFDRYGDVDVLAVVDVDHPRVGADDVLVRVRAAGINPGEAKIRSGALRLAGDLPASWHHQAELQSRRASTMPSRQSPPADRCRVCTTDERVESTWGDVEGT